MLVSLNSALFCNSGDDDDDNDNMKTNILTRTEADV